MVRSNEMREAKEDKVSEEQPKRPRRDVSDPEREQAPGDEVEPGTPDAGEDLCPECNGSGRLDDGQECPNCLGRGVILKVVGGGG